MGVQPTLIGTFVTDVVDQHKHLFSAIAVAETNIESCHKNVYQLNNYTSDLSDQFPGKNRGREEVLLDYIISDYIFTVIDELTCCTRNLESRFMNITNATGTVKDFLKEWEDSLAIIPKTKVHLLDDVNIDMLKALKI